MPKDQEYSLLPKSTLLSIQEVSQERIVVSEPKQHMGRPRSKIDAKILAQHLLGDKSDDRYVAFSREVLHYIKKFGGNITNGN
jgi:ribosomal protein S24E